MSQFSEQILGRLSASWARIWVYYATIAPPSWRYAPLDTAPSTQPTRP